MASIQRLLDIMVQLRDPETGCPWDRQQDFSSISPFTIEEAYEVDEAIRSGDLEAIRDELGDLLFQVVFQSRIAEESGAFDFDGVVDAIASKLVRRHPHVFARAATPRTVEAQTESWESIKAGERAAAAAKRRSGRGGAAEGQADPSASVFAGIPRSLPALARSLKIAGRAAQADEGGRAGEAVRDVTREAPPSEPAWAKGLKRVRRSLDRAESALREVSARPERGLGKALVGEGLRSWVVLARSLGIDPEQALREADDDFIEAYRNSDMQ